MKRGLGLKLLVYDKHGTNAFCSILLIVLLCGCLKRQSPKKYTARYGIEYNSVRDSLGIVLLDSSWVAFKVWDGVTAWGPQEKKHIRVMLINK